MPQLGFSDLEVAAIGARRNDMAMRRHRYLP
jgi:hypothetical protein